MAEQGAPARGSLVYRETGERNLSQPSPFACVEAGLLLKMTGSPNGRRSGRFGRTRYWAPT